MTVLVVDVGAANTVAVDGTGGPVPVDGAPWIPTVDRGVRDVRAVLTRVVAAAGATPDELVLTVGQDAEVAAAAQGLAPRVSTVAAPVAVAAGAGLVRGQELLVVDVGATTCAVTLVRRTRDGFTIVDSTVLPADFDQRILDRVAPSLRSPVTSARDRQRLHDSARAAKELLSRHDRADIVLPDHRAVRLTRAEFEELIAPDVDRVVAIARQVAAPVALVGGASRVPLLARRLTEATGRPVHVDPEPETAVARGAAALVTAPAPGARRSGVAIAALALALLLVGVFLVVPEPRTPGRATAGAVRPASPPTLPAPVAGSEVLNPAPPSYDDAEFGRPVTFRHASGTELELVFDGIETRPFGSGYRWLQVSYRATHVAGPSWDAPFASTAALDDRGQWITPVDGGVACEGTEPVADIPAGATVEVCGLLPVPDQTTVHALVFGDRQSAVRVPTSVPAVSGAGPAPASIAGRLGGPPVTVDGLTATFELVVTPSAYVGERRPAGGNRLVVLRAALSAVTDQKFYLRDDRGVLTPPLPDPGDLPDCPTLTESAEPVYGCLVYETDADSPVAGVTVGRPLDGETDSETGSETESGTDLAHWPTWTP